MSNEENKIKEVTHTENINQISDLDKNLLIKLLDSLIEEQNLIPVKE